MDTESICAKHVRVDFGGRAICGECIEYDPIDGESPIDWPCVPFQLLTALNAAEDALSELVELKAIKDRDGKTDDYKRRQPLAWEQAKRVLGE